MNVVQREPQVGDVVMLGYPTLRPAYLNGCLLKLIAREDGRFDWFAEVVSFPKPPPRNATWRVGRPVRVKGRWLVGVVAQKDEEVAA